MKFDIEKVNGRTAGLSIGIPVDNEHAANLEILNGNVDVLEFVLRSYALICGDKTKQRLCNAINRPHSNMINGITSLASHGVDYSDTPIRGLHYVYLWFDVNGELFYIGKGSYGRAVDMRNRNQEFRDKADGGQCKYVAYNLDEIYALDLERILIWEAVHSGKQLLNVNGGNGLDVIRYFKDDRDALLYYWNREGAIDRFSELTGIPLIYNIQNTNVKEALDERISWWGKPGQPTNDPSVLASMKCVKPKKVSVV